MKKQTLTVTAHAGSMSTPDNSLESLQAAVNAGADIVELDVNFLEDMTPVLSHNTPKGNSCVLLSEAFELLAPHKNILLNLDMKHTYDLKAVENEAEKYSLEKRIFFTGIEEKDVEAVKNQCRFTPFYLNFSFKRKSTADDYERICKTAAQMGALGLNTDFKTLTEECVRCFHDSGLLVSAWTVNRKRNMKKLIRMGVDNITTRRPDKFLLLLSR